MGSPAEGPAVLMTDTPKTISPLASETALAMERLAGSPRRKLWAVCDGPRFVGRRSGRGEGGDPGGGGWASLHGNRHRILARETERKCEMKFVAIRRRKVDDEVARILEAKQFSELLACPFCWSRDVELTHTWTPSYWVVCNECGAEAHDRISPTWKENSLREHKRSIKNACASWNRRHP